MIQHHHIDLGSVLRGTVCALYSNLVTRPTGAAVRTEIERAIEELGGRTVTVIDFSQVTILDFSCADEIVAKLMLRYARLRETTATDVADAPVTDIGYFVFRGLREHHLEAVEAVLERHRLAIVAVIDGVPSLVGDIAPNDRETWERLRELGRSDARTVAMALGRTIDTTVTCLDALAARRLVVRLADAYVALGTAELPPAPEAAA